MASEGEGLNDAAEDSKSRKIRFNYKDEHDLLLLREVLGDDGLFSNRVSPIRDCWKNIAQRLQLNGMAVTTHSCQVRLRLIYQKFIDDERQSKKASGVDEENNEKVQLLTEYHSLVEEAAALKEEKANKIKKERKRTEKAAKRSETQLLNQLSRYSKEDG
ncbi:unnamed protein product [Aphanomyces euteiches]|nr:hypothetical protein AeRB84_015844 [Aphanomyces euteiches]KAH9147169.1 hypothetical protein AeRB84_009156 [Aphanomyces euteiches]